MSKNKKSRRFMEPEVVTPLDFETWLNVFDVVRANYPKIQRGPLASQFGLSANVVHRLLYEGFLVEWCPGPIVAILQQCTSDEIDDMRDALVGARIHGHYHSIPRYRLNNKQEGELIGRGTWVELGLARAPAESKQSKRPSRYQPQSQSESTKMLLSSRSFSSGLDLPRSSAIASDLTSQIIQPNGNTLIQVNTAAAAPASKGYSDDDVTRLKTAAARAGLDLSVFATALRTAMLQEMDLIANVRGEALATMKAFSGLAEMMRRRMQAFAKKMREEELRGWPSMNVADVDKELRTILQFLEIQKRFGQITSEAIESEQKRLGDAEAWRRRTDTLLFGVNTAEGLKGDGESAVASKAKKMTDEQVDEVTNWLGVPQLAEGVKTAMSTITQASGSPTQNSPQNASSGAQVTPLPSTGQAPPTPAVEPSPVTQRPLQEQPAQVADVA